MKDKYLLNRFLACCFYKYKMIKDDQRKEYVYKDDIDELLGNGLDILNHMQPEAIRGVESSVKRTLSKSFYYLGADGFRLSYGEGKRRTPINMNVFETVMIIMLYAPDGEKRNKQRVKETILKFLESTDFRENIGNYRDSAAKLNWRIKQAEKIGKALNNDKKIGN